MKYCHCFLPTKHNEIIINVYTTFYSIYNEVINMYIACSSVIHPCYSSVLLTIPKQFISVITFHPFNIKSL